MLQQPGRGVDLADATRCGQQLFFANLGGARKRPHHYLEPAAPAHRHGTSRHRKPRLSRLSRVTSGHDYRPVAWSQLPLFEMELDPEIVKARAVAADSDLLRFCDQVARDHGAAHGWTRKQTNDVRRSLRLLQVLQDTPGSKIYATDVLKVPGLVEQGNVSALSTLDILAAAGLLIDDRTSVVERFFSKQIAGLPAAMTVQLRIWFDIMLNGSTTPPRRRPRHPETAKLHIRAIAPIVRVWASQGHDSLAGIERDDILARLPAAGPRRHTAEQGLRSLFGVLKARKAIFIDPTRGIPYTNTNNTIPLPLDTDAIRAALNSPDPAAALAVALVAFHALTSRQIRGLEITDISDARLTLDGRSIPLAGPVLPRLSAWLDHRNRIWPTTVNPHLFINRRTGPRLTQVSRPFPWKQVNLRAQTLREDRILDEVRATGGDVRRVCELFGLGVDAALRYTATLDQPDLEQPLHSP